MQNELALPDIGARESGSEVPLFRPSMCAKGRRQHSLLPGLPHCLGQKPHKWRGGTASGGVALEELGRARLRLAERRRDDEVLAPQIVDQRVPRIVATR